MAVIPNRTRELVLPAASFGALRGMLAAELGPDSAARMLRRMGHAAGDAVVEALNLDAEAESRAGFWRRLGEFFAARGWGRLTHEAVHSGVGALESADWYEAEVALGAERPSCFFTTGLLANVLGDLAGDEIGLLETECRGRGDLRCRFLFGARPALDRVFEAIRDGDDTERALARLSS